MYFALRVDESEPMSHHYSKIILASKNKGLLESILDEIQKLSYSVSCSIIQIDSDSIKMVSSYYFDEGYGCAYWVHSGLGAKQKELDYLLRKEKKESPENTSSIVEVNFVELLEPDARIAILKDYCSCCPDTYLEGYERKRKAKESGEYYQSPQDYDEFKGIDIYMKDDVFLGYRYSKH